MKPATVKRILVALDLTHQSGREHLEGFYRYADRKKNWKILLATSMEESNIPSIKNILNDHIDGAIIKGRSIASLIDPARPGSLPLVVIDKPSAIHGIPVQVGNDNTAIGLAAANFFASLGRFASYGFVPNENNSTWSQIRYKAFADSISARYKGTAVSVASESLSEWLLSLRKPAAVFAAFDFCGCQVLDCCRDNKLKVPRDIVVLGVDDDKLVCEHTRPKLSSIHPDHVRQGFIAAKELDKLMSSHKKTKEKSILCPQLSITERNSTSFVPPAVHIVREAESYIATHALKGVRVEDVVRHLRIPTRLANLRYSQATGHSIRDELVRRRLTEAKRLLAETKYAQKQVALMCGFKSTIVLSHLFHAHFGMSMRDYRKSIETIPN